MGPVMVSTWVQPINQAINGRFGSRLYGGAGMSALEYASNLYLVIAGTFILSVTNVIFPRLSRLTAGGHEGEFQNTIRQTLGVCLFLVLPMSAGLTAVARPLISLIYGGGAFDAFSTEITASALAWMSLGMTGYAVQNILSRAYFARQQGRVPLIAGGGAILVNLLLCRALTHRFQVAGLALSSAIAATVYALLLLLPLQRSRGVAAGRLRPGRPGQDRPGRRRYGAVRPGRPGGADPSSPPERRGRCSAWPCAPGWALCCILCWPSSCGCGRPGWWSL